MIESQMDKFGILSIRGRDKVGVAATASLFLAERGANIVEENTQALSEFFSGTLVFSAKPEEMRRIKDEVRDELSDYEPIVIDKPPVRDRVVLRYDLNVVAEDEPRIAATIEKIMGERCVNMKEIRGRTLRTHGCGKNLYSGSFRLEIGNAGTLRRLREDLHALEDENGWEIDLRPEGSSRRQLEVFTISGSAPMGSKPQMELCGKN